MNRKLLFLLIGAAVTPSALGNDFPTLARVEYVLGCMNQIGNQNYDTLYQCVCSADKIAERLSFDDYSEAQTFTMLRSTPGEKGGVFRDPPQAEELREALADAQDYARASCFLKANK
jgi:hypothetical protein